MKSRKRDNWSLHNNIIVLVLKFTLKLKLIQKVNFQFIFLLMYYL